MAANLRIWMWRSVGVSALSMVVLAFASSSTMFADADKAPTFTKDIAPIFQAKCESCHRPNNMAPMPLITYEDARPWARAIAQRVETRQMPFRSGLPSGSRGARYATGA